MSESKAGVSPVEVTEDMIKRLERDVRRGVFKILTPYTVAQAYGIKISVAKKLLREAEKRGIIVLYSGGRTPVFVKPELYKKLEVK